MRVSRGHGGISLVSSYDEACDRSCRLRHELSVVALAGDAAAEPPSDTPTVSLDVEVEWTVRAQGTEGSTSCTGPCTLRVAPGIVRLSTAEVTQDIYVEAPSRVTLTRGVPALQTAGAVTPRGGRTSIRAPARASATG